MTLIIPSRRAASVPTLGCSQISASLAGGVSLGSTTISFIPRYLRMLVMPRHK
ncbi:MAG: hypothetical protein R6U37_07105 [Dehalococcoidia bacterium]